MTGQIDQQNEYQLHCTKLCWFVVDVSTAFNFVKDDHCNKKQLAKGKREKYFCLTTLNSLNKVDAKIEFL